MKKYRTYANFTIKECNETVGLIEAVAFKHGTPSGTIVTSDTQPKQQDLLYVESVFVSSGMNLNDDVFIPSELWAAISSIPNKPVDWGHDQNQIIGHMTEAFPVAKDGTKITAAEAPVIFDVINRAVVYKWLFPEKARTIVEDSKANKLFVSMEVWFDSFDYMVGNKVVARNEQTEFLDGHLRVHGGDGFYHGEKVGRVLRNMIFGGKGFVRNPANPDSTIDATANKENLWREHIIQTIADISSTPTILRVEDIEMTNTDPAEANKMSDTLNKEIEALKAQLVAANDKIAKFEVADTAKTIEALKTQVASKDAEIVDLTAKLAEAGKKVDELTPLVAENKELKEKLAKAEDAIAKVARAQNIAKRMVVLDSKFNLSDEAKAKIQEKIADLKDEEFEAYVTEREAFAKSLKVADPVTVVPAKPEDSTAKLIEQLLKEAEKQTVVIPSAPADNEEATAIKDVAAALGFGKSEKDSE
jgi:hypothetical protein